jgi:GUN4-like
MIFTNNLLTLLLALVLSSLFLSPVLSQDTILLTKLQIPVKRNNFPLKSPETRVDYTPLEDRLKQQQWQEANETSTELLLKSVKRDQQGWISNEDMFHMACWDLKIIDHLWKKYSDGRFGFTAQFNIFVATGNMPEKLGFKYFYNDFGTRVGWRKNDQWITFTENLIYSLDAPIGHLPTLRSEYDITGGQMIYTAITQKMMECGMAYPSVSKLN